MSTGENLAYKLKAAVPECRKQVINHELFEDVLRKEDVENWRQEVLAWEADKTKPNPYAVRVKRELLELPGQLGTNADQI
jgi:hypothetical protein